MQPHPLSSLKKSNTFFRLPLMVKRETWEEVQQKICILSTNLCFDHFIWLAKEFSLGKQPIFG